MLKSTLPGEEFNIPSMDEIGAMVLINAGTHNAGRPSENSPSRFPVSPIIKDGKGDLKGVDGNVQTHGRSELTKQEAFNRYLSIFNKLSLAEASIGRHPDRNPDQLAGYRQKMNEAANMLAPGMSPNEQKAFLHALADPSGRTTINTYLSLRDKKENGAPLSDSEKEQLSKAEALIEKR